MRGHYYDLQDWREMLKPQFDPWVEVHRPNTVFRSGGGDGGLANSTACGLLPQRAAAPPRRRSSPAAGSVTELPTDRPTRSHAIGIYNGLAAGFARECGRDVKAVAGFLCTCGADRRVHFYRCSSLARAETANFAWAKGAVAVHFNGLDRGATSHLHLLRRAPATAEHPYRAIFKLRHYGRCVPAILAAALGIKATWAKPCSTMSAG